MRFVDTFRKLGPPWLIDNEVGESLATMLDTFAARARAALTARFPAYAPDAAALAALGRDRRIVRGIGEPAAAYAARLSRAFTDLQTRGNPYSLMEQIRAFLQVDVLIRTVDVAGNYYEIAVDGTRSTSMATGLWDWDSPPANDPRWARFWLIIYPTGGTLPWAFDSAATFGDGSAWGDATVTTEATENEVAGLRSIIREWKPAGTRCEWIIVSYDAAYYGPDGLPTTGTQGDWSTIASGVRGISRNEESAVFFAGANR